MMRMKSGISVGISVVALCLPLLAQTNTAKSVLNVATVDNSEPVYSLDQFGPVTNPASAAATLEKASKDIIAAGGGVIIIPTNAPAGWLPKNNSQQIWRIPPPPAPAKRWGIGVGVTIVDARGSALKIFPPQAAGLEINRTLNLPEGDSLPFWGYFPMLSLRNKILNGSTSYREPLLEPVTAGTDRRFYVNTIRGVFPGAFFHISGNGDPRLYVKSLGYDKEKQLWYFVADVDGNCPKGCIIGNKNHVNLLDMITESHTENQTFDVRNWRYNYSQGDNYLYDGRFHYMGDNHSTGGDENAVLYAAFTKSMADVFRGYVRSWDPASGTLVYSNGYRLGATLGTGRPLINLNPAKWLTNGTVMIVRPASWTEYGPNQNDPVFQGKTYPTTLGKDRRSGWGTLHMGGLIHFSADAPVTEDAIGRYFAIDEKDELVPGGPRRWYLIDSVTKNADGTKDIQIVRHWWGAKPAGSPTLYKPENYSSDGHEKPLRYIIAPGANVYDVAEGVTNPQATMKLVPTPFTGAPADFAGGDAIEQALGPDPFKPIPFRTWLWDNVPGAFPAPVFDVSNKGTMRDSVLKVHGGNGSIESDQARNYDRNPYWDKLLAFDATCNTGIRFGADTGDAAILFEQPHNRIQPIKWYYGATNAAPKTTSLSVSRETGEFNFSGPISVTGLSADGKIPSRNLRGKDVAVKAGETRVTIAFPAEEADSSYAVFIEKNWLGDRAIAKKDTKGFTIQFEKPAPADATLDWMIVR